MFYCDVVHFISPVVCVVQDGQKEDKIDAIQTKDGKSDKQEKAKDGVKDKAKDKEKGNSNSCAKGKWIERRSQ